MKTRTMNKLVDIRIKFKTIPTAIKKNGLRQICPYCGTDLIQFSDGWQPPVCENPTCPTNNYTPKGHD